MFCAERKSNGEGGKLRVWWCSVDCWTKERCLKCLFLASGSFRAKSASGWCRAGRQEQQGEQQSWKRYDARVQALSPSPATRCTLHPVHSASGAHALSICDRIKLSFKSVRKLPRFSVVRTKTRWKLALPVPAFSESNLTVHIILPYKPAGEAIECTVRQIFSGAALFWMRREYRKVKNAKSFWVVLQNKLVETDQN